MSANQYPIPLVDGSTKQVIDAVLFDSIEDRHIDDFEQKWQPWLANWLAQNPHLPRQESAHWDWRRKTQSLGNLLAYPSFAIEYGNETQGLMIVTNMHACRIPSQKGKPSIYVEFLETAPWNRSRLTIPKYKRVGPALIDVAIQLSLHDGFDGRIALHSLPQSDDWYRTNCGMTDLGQDPDKNLRYFEMTEIQARAFVGLAR